MKKKIMSYLVISLVWVLILIYTTACAAAADNPSSIANPASEFCIENGGISDIRESENGQIGWCVFADGSECDEWEFFRGECTPQGSTILIPSEPQGEYTTGPVFVNDASISIAESYPVQIFVNIKGEMPTPCDQLQVIFHEPDDKNHIQLELLSWQPESDAVCSQVLSPFTSNFGVPTDTLPEGTYTIWLDGQQIGEFTYPA